MFNLLGVVSVIPVGCEVFSYIRVWGNTSNMIFILNFCFAHSITHVGSVVAAPKFLGQLEMRQQNCAFHFQCSWCQFSAVSALSHKQYNYKRTNKQFLKYCKTVSIQNKEVLSTLISKKN